MVFKSGTVNVNGWEIGLFVFVLFLAARPFLSRRGRDRTVLAGVLLLTVSVAAAWPRNGDWPVNLDFSALSLEPPPPTAPMPERLHPAQVERAGYVSSKSCRSCHPEQYASWHATYHRTMTQVVSPQTVLASFDNVRLESRGRTYDLERRGDEFWVTMADPNWELNKMVAGFDLEQIERPRMVTRKIVMSTGSHHLQGYWLADTDGLGQRFMPWMYHIAENRWIPIEDTFLKPPDDTRTFLVWNNNCIKCHSVGGNPKAPAPMGPMPSEVAEFGISCEACHGPAEEHVAFYRNPLARYRQHFRPESDSRITNPTRLSHVRASQICGQCHSGQSLRNQGDYLSNGCRYHAGDDLDETHHVYRPHAPEAAGFERIGNTFWSDGTCRVGGDEYNGLTESPCFQRGTLSCLSCHSMHNSDPNDQLAEGMHTNRACLQCHESYADRIEEHTHHPAGSSGSLCYNCHMPHTTFALFTAMRSHRVVTPRIERVHSNGRPNACNLCHLNETLEWSAHYLSDWYGQEPVELAEDEKTTAASLLWLLRGDAAQRIITAWHMGWPEAHAASGNDWQAPFVSRLLDDPYAAVRFVAFAALRRLPGFDEFAYDFLAPEQERREAAERSLAQWRQSGAAATGESGGGRERILIAPSGDWLHDRVQELLERRDETPVNIPE